MTADLLLPAYILSNGGSQPEYCRLYFLHLQVYATMIERLWFYTLNKYGE